MFAIGEDIARARPFLRTKAMISLVFGISMTLSTFMMSHGPGDAGIGLVVREEIAPS